MRLHGLHKESGLPAGSSRRSGIALLSLMIVLGSGSLMTAHAQIVLEKKPVRVSAQGELSAYWEVLEAGFREDLTGTLGYLNLKNISEMPLQDAILYGEYFDAEGRQCFSLVFSLNQDPRERHALGPGESRVIDSDGFGLFPALEPEEVKLYLVQLMLPSGANPLRTWDVTVRAPITVSGGGGSRIQLDPEVVSRLDTVSDLILARLAVDEAGRLENLNVLQASADPVESWFRDFFERQASLSPALNGAAPEKAYALVLVRLVLNEDRQEEVFVPPRMSPWVKSYVQAVKDNVIPPVTTLMFMRPPTKVKPIGSMDFVYRPALPPGLFELRLGDTRWSEPPVHWVTDPTMLHHLRREVGLSKY